MSRYLYKKIQNISPESLNFQHSGLKLTTLGSDPMKQHWGLTRAPSKGHFTEQAEILHEKRITTSFVSESCMALGNWNHEA